MTPGPPAGRRPLRVLFSMGSFWYVRLFESVIRELAGRGHAVHLLGSGEGKDSDRQWLGAAEALMADCPGVSIGWAPREIDDEWVDLRLMVHLGLDYLRFLEPAYRDTPALAARARSRTPRPLVTLAESPVLNTRLGRRVLRRGLRLVERCLPLGRQLAAAIAGERPDVVLVTPLITLGSRQHEVVRVARELGIPSALCVGSWDHLSSKALIRERPDRVLVWNETQRQEAHAYHGMSRDRVVVTGAQCFDQWFDRRPTLSRDAFCARVRLDAGRPYVLWVCSALFDGSPSEAEFVARWVAALRASADGRLRDVGVLIRPHPKRGFEWDSVDLSGLANVVLWPKQAEAPFHEDAKANYFDSLYHSAAVVGLNTSAQIEAGIIGRPVHTVLLPEFRPNQQGTLHFHYLLDGGLLRAGPDLAAHLAQLSASLAADTAAAPLNRAFVEQFVRPRGLGVPATPIFADTVEAIVAAGARARAEAWWAPLGRRALLPLARRTRGTVALHAHRERRRREKQVERQAERSEAVARRASARLAAREARTAAHAAARQERLREKRLAQDAAKGRERLQ